MIATARRGDDERGLMVILFALAMTVILVVAALVLDVAQLRTDRRVNKSVADTAARAGLGVLHAGPWPGVCRAAQYLKANSRFGSFDPGSEVWSRPVSPAATLPSSPCSSPTTSPYTTACSPGQPATWARIRATAGAGTYTVEIQSGYALPDARFADDPVATGDSGDPAKGSCDNLAVIITERRNPIFGGLADGADKTTRIRSVGRRTETLKGEDVPALLLLEQHACSVLSVTSNNARVIAQPSGGQPGVLHLDTAADQGSCSSNQAALNGKATTGGPSIVACSIKAPPTPGCRPGTGSRASRVGVHGLSFQHPANVHLTSGPGTYGDTPAVPVGQVGRAPVDATYRQAVAALDATAKDVLTGTGNRPPGCAAVSNGACTTSDGTSWVVLQQADCNSYGAFLTPARAAARRIWFNCDLTIASTPVTLTGADAEVVVTGALVVRKTLAVRDGRRVYVGGRTGGNGIGLEVGNGGNLNVGNPTPGAACTTGSRTSAMVVGNGSFTAGSGGAVHLCGTFVHMASGFTKVPATDGTAPCTCAGLRGTVAMGSGAAIDWLAPNVVTDRRPTPAELVANPFEDLALWTEAGGSDSSVGGNANTDLAGVYFLPNADEFTLAGGAGLDVSLSAQFVARRMRVTGGAAVNLVPNPYDAVALPERNLLLVR